jgi:hypothetical protein
VNDGAIPAGFSSETYTYLHTSEDSFLEIGVKMCVPVRPESNHPRLDIRAAICFPVETAAVRVGDGSG